MVTANNLLTKAQAYIDQDLFDEKKLQRAHDHLSHTYRQNKGTYVLTTSEHIKAYFMARMPATFASISQCLLELPFGYAPKTVLDLGAGPGTATLAALERWPSLKTATLVEQHPLMVDISKKLFSYLDLPASINHHQESLLKARVEGYFDFVVLSYVLGELQKEEQLKVIENAWNVTSEFLLIASPGTPFDYDIQMEVREFLISKGGFIVAPCPHHKECPLRHTKDWCHFSVRLNRTREHQKIKHAFLSYEDEKYTYLLFSKKLVQQLSKRIIKKPLQRSGHIIMDLCATDGIKRETIGRKDKEIFKRAIKKEWGETWS